MSNNCDTVKNYMKLSINKDFFQHQNPANVLMSYVVKYDGVLVVNVFLIMQIF